MNLRDLHYLTTVAELRHFSKAAEQCHVSQPTLSGQIKKLEQQLGVVLFERTNKRVIPTEIGEQVVASARRILSEMRYMEEIARGARDPEAGTLRLGAFPTLATYIFPTLVPELREAMPKLRLVLVEEKTAELIRQLKAGELDAALLALPAGEDGLVEEPLFCDAFYVATPPDHPLAGRETVSHDDLLPYQLLLLEEGHCLRDQALGFCQRHGIREEQDVRATGLETLRQMVRAGTGITFMPAIAREKREDGICYIPFNEPVPERVIGLVYRPTTAKAGLMRRVNAMLRVTF